MRKLITNRLTQKQLRIVRLLAAGFVSREIAEILGTTVQTVKNDLLVARMKYDARTSLEMALIAVKALPTSRRDRDDLRSKIRSEHEK